MNDKLKHYERVEEALHETLQTAKDSAEQKLTGARKEAKNTIEKAEMEADGIIRDANSQRQQIRQSILRLLDRREEIIGGIKSYLDLSRESLQQFSKDEASLFTMPKEEDLDNRLQESIDKKKESSEKRNNSLKSSPVPPGAQSLDDILDELD
jgi:cell division initiation protein